jgi:hypothetical protein
MQPLKILLLIIFIISYLGNSISPGPKNTSPSSQPSKDTIIQNSVPNKTPDTTANIQNALPIDTALNKTQIQTDVQQDTIKKIDSTLIEPVSENILTNTKLFIYILLSVLGLGLFFFIFVINLFKTFHKKKSTRQSLLLSWNLFFIISIIWIFIIWGLVAGFWSSASFMIVVIFLFIISLIMTIIAIKSK